MGFYTQNLFSSFTSASSWFEVYAAFSTFMMLLRTAFHDLIPQQFRSLIATPSSYTTDFPFPSSDLNRLIFPPQSPDSDSPQQPLLKALSECASLSETEPDQAAESLSRLRKSVSQHGNPTERVGFYFWQALSRKMWGDKEKMEPLPSRRR